MPTVRPGCLIVFTRFPEPGKTKTRMIPALGAQGAARLQRRMTEHIMATAATLNQLNGRTVEVRHEGGNTELMQNWLGSQFEYRPQGSGHLGQRMQRAVKAAFAKNPASVVIIGSDIPGISVDIIQQAFEALQSNDLALGPAQDGGYYLIGINSTLPAETYGRLFDGIDWGTNRVLAQTLQIADGLKLRSVMLHYLTDVDRPGDLPTWYQAQKKAARPSCLPKVSIIIPTLNEAAVIERTLSRLQNIEHLEVIVVDGGSTDETVDLAESMGVQVLQTSPGKAAQMNWGAWKATGEVLVFLHADTIMPGGFDHLILDALNQKGVLAGAFRLAIESNAAGIRFIERMTNLRSRVIGLPYGDQALFMKKSTFKEVGGYANLPIMEDFVLMRHLRRKGKIAILPDRVITSPRRWLHFGILKTWLVNQAIVIAFYLGVAPERLARWYRREAGKKDN